MIVDVKNCSSCKGNHRVQAVELVNPVPTPGQDKASQTSEANRFFYCPRTGKQIFVKLDPGQKEIDLSRKDVAA